MELSDLRIGIGHDTHRLAAGGPLKIGGIEIDFDFHLVGHSDADVLLHAVTDSILGLAAAGDIGELFPDTAKENLGRDSVEMLQAAHVRIQSMGFHLINLDCIIFAERPKFSPFKKEIGAKIAEALGIESSCVNVKAKTGEGIGDVGNQHCIMTQCIALGYKKS